jgi:hypothetical protein
MEFPRSLGLLAVSLLARELGDVAAAEALELATIRAAYSAGELDHLLPECRRKANIGKNIMKDDPARRQNAV